MLEIVELTSGPYSGRYAVQNNFTGLILPQKNGMLKTFRTLTGAVRFRNRQVKSFNKTITKLSNHKI